MGNYLDSAESTGASRFFEYEQFAECVVYHQNNHLCGDGNQIFIPAQNTDSQYTDAPV